MKHLCFTLSYRTQWGEQLVLIYAADDNAATTLPLTTVDGEHWIASLELPDTTETLRHRYAVVDIQGTHLREEHNSWRLFHFNGRENVYFSDVWTVNAVPNLYHRAPFTADRLLSCADNISLHQLLAAPCLMLLNVPPVTAGEEWFLTGNTPTLGAWDEHRALPLQRTSVTEWAVALAEEDVSNGFEYKFLLRTPSGSVRWESGENHIFPPTPLSTGETLVRSESMPRGLHTSFRRAGAVVPVFSLRSHTSFGVGDFLDLQTFIRWTASTGMKAVQLLPINDTTTSGSWRDSYPYNCVSVFALHPIYLAPEEWSTTEAYHRCKAEAEELNALPALDYERVFALKQRFLHELFAEKGKEICSSEDYKKFVEDEAEWLEPYVQYCTLRTFHHTADFRSWPDERTDAYGMDRDMEFHRFTQFLLHRQMLAAHETARSLGVMIKGDIPIGVSPCSVAAWKDSRLFHFDGTAGAPPDDFARNGQNWGFPTYNWEEMARDNYRWWRRRLSHMATYFDAYRLDHVLGFFRIWEVPSSQIYGTLGHFRPSLPLSEDEICQKGFTLPVKSFTLPTLRIDENGGYPSEFNSEILATYFDETSSGYVLKERYRSQRTIASLPIVEELKKTLLDLVADVLFLPDPDKTELFHPRVGAQQTAAYRSLPQNKKEAFDRIHNDFFYFRHNVFWEAEAMKKLPAVVNYAPSASLSNGLFPLQTTGMLPCAEDLGMVPACVKGVLEQLEVLSLEIQRMPKTWGHRFAPLEENPPLSVATIATHDMPPLRLWWKENAEQTTAFWHEALHHTGTPPEEATPEVCEEVVKAHLASPSMFCLLSLQDWLSISHRLRSSHPEEEQINVPANPDQYWRYRMHLSLETLLQASGFNEKVRALCECSNVEA